jgi:hypothetical protein
MKKTYWWYIEIVKFHLVARQRKSLKTAALGDYLRVIGVPNLRGGHGAAVLNSGRATDSRV